VYRISYIRILLQSIMHEKNMLKSMLWEVAFNLPGSQADARVYRISYIRILLR
jgi:hypothetical protein